MKNLIIFGCLLSITRLVAQQTTIGDYPYKTVNFTAVTLQDNFWLPRMEINRQSTIPHSFAKCEETGRVKNFLMAAQHSGKFCTTYPFDDTDIFKTLEGAAYSLSIYPDPALDRYCDSMIAIIAKAQEPDGYLYTARSIDPVSGHSWMGTKRWEKENELSHELYNAGHLYEAAAAHFLATKYLKLAKYFIESRGKKQYVKSSDIWTNGTYWQDHQPVIQQKEATGHAVRATYLYTGMADVAASRCE